MNFFLSSRWSVRLALIIIALLALIALTSQWWLPYDPQAIDLDAQHWLGTDHLGRDIFSRLMAATRVSLGSVIACLLLVLTLGLVIGGSAGLIGGRVDQATMRVADMFMTFPTSIRNYRHRPVALGVVCTHGAQPGDFTAPARVCAGITAFWRRPCAGVC